jgi:hypothetical protein
MPRKTLSRGASALLATFVAVLAVAAPAAPAFADDHGCCQVSVDRLPAQFVAGGDPQSFTLHVTNAAADTLRVIDVSFTLVAGGLVGDLVDLERQIAPSGPHDVGTFTQHGVHDGAVTAGDEINLGALAVPPGGGVDIQYELTFRKKVPSSALTLSVQVQPKHGGDGGGGDRAVSSAGPYQSQIVAAGQAAPTPSDTPTATDTSTSTAGPDATTTTPVASGIEPGGGGGSLVWLAYTLGGLLLVGGVGLIGTLLARRGSRRIPAEVQTYPAPAATALLTPTTQFPISQDPWADPDQTWVDPSARR